MILLNRTGRIPAAYHHSISRPERTFALLAGLGVRSSNTGQETSFITFSAIDPKTSGCQPVSPCVEITTISAFSRSTVSRMALATSSPT